MRGAGVVLLMFVALGFLAGFGVCQWVSHKPEPSAVATSHQPEVRVSPGNVTAAREPVKKAEPAAPVTKGATVTRTAHVVVKPKPANHFAEAGKMVCECEPVRVDLTQFKDETGERLKFTSPDGEILEASDKPVIGEIVGAPRLQFDAERGEAVVVAHREPAGAVVRVHADRVELQAVGILAAVAVLAHQDGAAVVLPVARAVLVRAVQVPEQQKVSLGARLARAAHLVAQRLQALVECVAAVVRIRSNRVDGDHEVPH